MIKTKAKDRTDFILTFFDIAYSLGGRSNVEKIYKTLLGIHVETVGEGKYSKKELLSPKEREVLECMTETYKRDGLFPSWAFLQNAFQIVSNAPVRNLGDFNTAINKLFDTRATEFYKMELSNAISQAEGLDDLNKMTQAAQEKYKQTREVSKFITYQSVKSEYEFTENAPQGITTGIETVDKLTAGLQWGTVASIAGFTSHGKSTLSNNLAYLNAAMGRKVAVGSLEIPALLTKYIYLSRHAYTMGKAIDYQTLIRSHLTKEAKDKVFEDIEPDFIEKVGKNLVIFGQEDITEWSEAGLELLYSRLDEALEGLELVIWDHVNEFRYVDPTSLLTGDHYIKFLTNITKSYINKKGNHPVTVFDVQISREGYKRAARRDGKYDMTALAEFNELERSSTYVLFTYADEAMRDNEQAKVQLLKHRLGNVMLEPENIEIQYRYAMVGRTFTDVIATIGIDREDEINDSFFLSEVGIGGSDFTVDASESEKERIRVKEEAPSNKKPEIKESTEETTEGGMKNWYKGKITSTTDDDFKNF